MRELDLNGALNWSHVEIFYDMAFCGASLVALVIDSKGQSPRPLRTDQRLRRQIAVVRTVAKPHQPA
jgi:hypothetical protein